MLTHRINEVGLVQTVPTFFFECPDLLPVIIKGRNAATLAFESTAFTERHVATVWARVFRAFSLAFIALR